jgi:hypothetical protein
MATISGCRHLKVNLMAKIYICVNSTAQRCPNKRIKIFLIEDFFHLPPVSTTPVVHLEPQISPRIFKKIRNGRNGTLRCLGETDSRKKPEVENLVALSLQGLSSLILYPLSLTPVANLPLVSLIVVDTGGKFAAGVVDTGGKLPRVSLIPAANLPRCR